MPNIAVVLRDEITRLARKEVRSQTASARKASTQYRRDIAALKRQVKGLEKQLAALRRTAGRTAPQPTSKPGTPARFMPTSLRAQRKRLGFSAADYAKLVGVTAQSIYNWERGISRPRQAQAARLAAVRGIGKREAVERLKTAARKS
jgi:DNA-binding transcriptional regulator YiaG